MSDAVLKIGSVFDKQGIVDGMAEGVSGIQSGVAQMSTSFQEIQGIASAAMKKISEDTIAAAGTVSDAQVRVAEATKASNAAWAEQRNAMKLVRSESGDTALATRILAAAQEKARTAAQDLKTAEAAAAEEGRVSSNVLVAAFQRIGLASEESLGEARERLYASSRGLSEGFSIGGIGSAFGELLGIGLVADMLGHFADESRKTAVELGHVAAQTGLAIEQLSGLKLIIEEMGGDWEASARGLFLLARATGEARDGSKGAIKAFGDIGVTADELKGKNPEQVLQLVASGFAKTADEGKRAEAIQGLFGRGGRALIPVLEEYGDKLTQAASDHAKLTGVTKESETAARQLTKDMADARAEVARGGQWLIAHAEYLKAAAATFGIAVETIFEGLATGVVTAGTAIVPFVKLLNDASHANAVAVASDLESIKNLPASIANAWKAGVGEIEHNRQVLDGYWRDARHPAASGAPDRGDDGDNAPGHHVDKNENEERLRSFEQALNEEKLLHSVSIQEEYDFWEQKISAFTKGSTQYGTVLGKLASLAEEGARKFHEALQKFNSEQVKGREQDATFAAEFGKISAEMNKWLVKTDEDLTRTGERWQGYWRAVAQGLRDEAQANAAFEEQQLAAKHAAGGLSDLAYAEQLQALHANTAKLEIKALTDELQKLQDMAKNAPHNPVTGDLMDPKLAEQIKQLENQIAQLQAKLKQQGFGDGQAVKNEITKPFTDAFQAINQGWLKVQRDLLLGTGNIKKDFAQMGADLVVQLAQNLEKMLAQWALYELRTVLAHKLANAAKTESDAQSSAESQAIGAQSAFKEIFMDAKQAAAGAYKALAGIPIVGPVLAPVGAATAFAGVMALAAFEKGGVVDGPTHMAIPILAHGGERVLSAAQTQNFDRMVNNNTSTSSSRTNNVRANIRQTFHGSKAAGPREAVAGMKKAYRNGQLGRV